MLINIYYTTYICQYVNVLYLERKSSFVRLVYRQIVLNLQKSSNFLTYYTGRFIVKLR